MQKSAAIRIFAHGSLRWAFSSWAARIRSGRRGEDVASRAQTRRTRLGLRHALSAWSAAVRRTRRPAALRYAQLSVVPTQTECLGRSPLTPLTRYLQQVSRSRWRQAKLKGALEKQKRALLWAVVKRWRQARGRHILVFSRSLPDCIQGIGGSDVACRPRCPAGNREREAVDPLQPQAAHPPSGFRRLGGARAFSRAARLSSVCVSVDRAPPFTAHGL